jgi:hypothetical protein
MRRDETQKSARKSREKSRGKPVPQPHGCALVMVAGRGPAARAPNTSISTSTPTLTPMPRPHHLLARLDALEKSRGILPTNICEWSDAQLRAASDAIPISKFLEVLTDEELLSIANAPRHRPLHDVLTARPAPWEWPEWASWNEETRAAVRESWGCEDAAS